MVSNLVVETIDGPILAVHWPKCLIISNIRTVHNWKGMAFKTEKKALRFVSTAVPSPSTCFSGESPYKRGLKKAKRMQH